MGNVLVNIIHRQILSLINQAMYLLNKMFVGWVIVARDMQKCDFFLKKVDEIISTYVLKLMLTLAKMQDDSTLMWKNFENWG